MTDDERSRITRLEAIVAERSRTREQFEDRISEALAAVEARLLRLETGERRVFNLRDPMNWLIAAVVLGWMLGKLGVNIAGLLPS